MALHIVEYSYIQRDLNGRETPYVAEPANVIQDPLTVGNVSAASDPFHADTRLVMLYSDEDCHIVFGYDNGGPPEATTDDRFLPANMPLIVGALPGCMVAVIEAAGA